MPDTGIGGTGLTRVPFSSRGDPELSPGRAQQRANEPSRDLARCRLALGVLISTAGFIALSADNKLISAEPHGHAHGARQMTTQRCCAPGLRRFERSFSTTCGRICMYPGLKHSGTRKSPHAKARVTTLCWYVTRYVATFASTTFFAEIVRAKFSCYHQPGPASCACVVTTLCRFE